MGSICVTQDGGTDNIIDATAAHLHNPNLIDPNDPEGNRGMRKRRARLAHTQAMDRIVYRKTFSCVQNFSCKNFSSSQLSSSQLLEEESGAEEDSSRGSGVIDNTTAAQL